MALKTVIRSLVFISIISEHYESVSSCAVLELVPLALVDPDLDLRRGVVLLALQPFLPSAIFFTQTKGGPMPSGSLA